MQSTDEDHWWWIFSGQGRSISSQGRSAARTSQLQMNGGEYSIWPGGWWSFSGGIRNGVKSEMISTATAKL
ncbi:hypothetical protein HYALB_00010916 [Hymenoscyphus albidus]|uniref:Uncharacterized protein n=1 Tax=Hymenoscyphus albidus TaxID=595503 RepID=A0A9N9LF29_9HELO|nr:hypothetical protein HYALB_00010916 [Hymenoscyphus albidus]